MADTKISYVDKSWNPVVGCTKCSPGCDNCYAEKMAHRLAFMGKEGYAHVTTREGKWNGKVYYLNKKALDQPLHWRKPCRILVPSMGDLFHEKVPIGFLTHVFDTIEQCPQHTFMVLTKRPKQALKMMWGRHDDGWRYFGEGDFHKNIHLGVTVCNQQEADEKIPILLQIPGNRWLSLEPMLGEIDIFRYFDAIQCPECGYVDDRDGFDVCGADEGNLFCNQCHNEIKPTLLDDIGQIIVGCESGPGRRPCKPEWIKSIVDQCQAAGVPVFVKQMEINGKVVHELKDMPAWAERELSK